jgi:ABC-type multidrug transport system fused ATPase/permease subunit
MADAALPGMSENGRSPVSVIGKLNAVLLPRERQRARIVFCLMLGTAFLEVSGIASVMPFIAVLANPGLVETNHYLAAAYQRLGFTSVQAFQYFLGAALMGLFVFGLVLKALTTYAIVRFSNLRLHSIAYRLLAGYLRQPYEFFLNRNTADLGKSILSEVRTVTDGVLMAGLRALAGSVVILALLVLLLTIEPLLSLVVCAIFGGTYGASYFLTRRLLSRIGKERVDANRRRFVLANEALNGIKELRLLGRVGHYLASFGEPSEAYARHHATGRVIGDMPFYVIQIAAFGGVLLMVLFLMGREGGLTASLPLISLYAFAGYRLLPTFQEVFRSATELAFSLPALDSLYDDLVQKEGRVARPLDEVAQPLRLKDSIRFDDVSYRYPNTERPALRNLSFTIPAGSSVAFVGSTGAGKSTATDLLLGLLDPSEGRILIDSQELRGDVVAQWQRSIGYVPQSLFLSDDTVSANIAFGVPKAEIDPKVVERAARAAHIHDFIVTGLDQGYDTRVGERGIRLSGGQRQRLAIARALYHDPDVIVFDEATSALDTATEASVMEAIEDLRGRKTVILITHRLSTIRNCDRLFVMRDGCLVEQGTVDDVKSNSPDFMNLMNAGYSLPTDLASYRRVSGSR